MYFRHYFVFWFNQNADAAAPHRFISISACGIHVSLLSAVSNFSESEDQDISDDREATTLGCNLEAAMLQFCVTSMIW
jgi:hypothetical protein